jgi:hypothetical protein
VSITSSHEAATAGTAAHEAMRAVVSGLDPDLDELARRHGVDRDELGRLVWYGRKIWTELAPSFPDPETEVTVTGGSLTGHVDLLSLYRSDPTLVLCDRAAGIDWKSGRKDSDYFHQVAGYAYCVLSEHSEVDEITFSVAWLRDCEVETYVFTRVQLEAWRAGLVNAMDSPDDFRTGPQCECCPRSTNCPALMAVVRRDVEMFSAEEPGALLDGATPDQLIAVLRRAKSVAKFAEGAEKLIRERVRASGPLVGSDGTKIALVEEPGARVIDTALAWPVLQERLTDDEIAKAVKVSITKAQDAVAEKAPPRGKGAAKKELSEALDAAGAVTQTTIEKLKTIRPPREISK